MRSTRRLSTMLDSPTSHWVKNPQIGAENRQRWLPENAFPLCISRRRLPHPSEMQAGRPDNSILATALFP
jgi:hypothetical protein